MEFYCVDSIKLRCKSYCMRGKYTYYLSLQQSNEEY